MSEQKFALNIAKSKAVVCADLHLDAYTWTSRREIRGDTEYALTEILRVAKENDADVLAAGDLFERVDIGSQHLQLMAELIDKLAEFGARFLYVQGQHEMSNPPWVETLARPNAFWVHDTVFVAANMMWWGCDYRSPEQLIHEPLKTSASVDCVLTHQVFKDLMGNFGNVSAKDFTNVATIYTGDYHKHRDLTLKDGPPHAIYSPGSPTLRAIDEEDYSGVYVIGAGNPQPEYVPIRNRPVFRRNVSTEMELVRAVADAEDFVNAANENPLYADMPKDVKKPLIVIRDLSGERLAVSAAFSPLGDSIHLYERTAVVPEGAVAVTEEAADDLLAGTDWVRIQQELYPEIPSDSIAARVIALAQNSETDLRAQVHNLAIAREEFFVKQQAN